MSTYVLMRILESAPRRYDIGIRILTLGRLDRAYDRLAGRIDSAEKVLDIGSGTGALALRAARRGAVVKGIDINAQMLEIAQERVREAGLAERVELVEMGVAELDREPAQSYDAVTSGLCLSELTEDELGFTLQQVARLLKPGGLLLVADEVKPASYLARVVHWLIRAPLAVLTFLVAQQTTRALADLPWKLEAVGLSIDTFRSSPLGDFCEIVARKPGGAEPGTG